MKGILKNKYIIVLIMIVLLGFLFRVFDLGSQSLWIDEGYTLNGSMAIVKHGYPLLDSGELYVNNILATYTTAAVLKTGLFDPFNPWSARVPFAVFGTLLILAVFYLSKKVFQNDKIAVLSGLITAFSYWEIAWSRQIRGYAACAFFLTIGLVFVWKFIESRKWLDVFYASVFTMIAGLFHLAGFVLIPMVISLIFTKALTVKRFTKVLLGTFIVQVALFFNLVDGVLPKILNLFSSIDLLFLFGLFVAVAIGLFIKESRDRFIFFGLLIVNLASSIVLFSPTIYSRYIFILMPIFIMLFSAGIVYSFKVLPSPKDYYLKYLAATVITIVAMIFLPNSFQWYPQSLYGLEKDSPQPDFAKVFSIIKSVKKEDDLIISIYPVMTNIYLGEKGLSINRPLKNSNLLKSDQASSSEYYVGATLIKDAYDLKEIMANKHGFIISERLFEQIIGDKIDLIESSPKSRLIYSSFEKGELGEDHINLYRF